MFWSLLSTATQAQSACGITADLQHLFLSLRTHSAQRSLPEHNQRAGLLAIASRHTPSTLNTQLQRTEIFQYGDVVVEGFTHANALLAGLSQTPPSLELLLAPETGITFNRALSVLYRLDCPAPADDASSIPNTNNPPPTLLATLFASYDKSFFAIGILTALTLLGIGFSILHRRGASLTKRFFCSIPVHFAEPETQREPITATAEDISRSGVKIGAIRGPRPAMNTMLTLQLGPFEKQLRVRWENTHYFGGQFTKPFTKLELHTLLGRKRRIKSRSKPRMTSTRSKSNTGQSAHKKGQRQTGTTPQ